MIREDVSNKLIHLTRGKYEDAAKTFTKILGTKKLLGSDKDIRGRYKVICL